MPNDYELVPNVAEDEQLVNSGDESEEAEEAPRPSSPVPPPDPRFHQPTPSRYTRAALLIFTAFLFWLAITLRNASNKPVKVVHANRYSKEFKFRPAASPIITETLKDGKMRVRGAAPTGRVVQPTPPADVKKTKRTTGAKGKAGRRKAKKMAKRF